MEEYQNVDDVPVESSKGKGIRATDDGSDQDNAVEEPEGPDPQEGPIMAVLSGRIRSKTKKLREIRRLEKKFENGEAITTAQQKRIDRKGDLTVEIAELVNLKKLLPEAIAEELSYKIRKHSITTGNTSESGHNLEGTEADETSPKKDLVSVQNGHAQGTEADETSAKEDLVSVENGHADVDAIEGTESDETSSMKDVVAVENGHAQVDATESAKNAEAPLDQKVEKSFYSFLKRCTLEGDDMPLYHGDAMALVSRRNMRVHYSDICTHDKRLAMEIVADYERLKPSLREAAKRFSREILNNTIKGLTRRRANAVNSNLESLNLTVIGKPKSHQMLSSFLEPPTLLMVDVTVQSGTENPMKTPSDIGASLLMGVLQDLITKHLLGLSCNGKLGIENVEIYNGKTYVINSPLAQYVLGSEQWSVACKNDFKSYADSFIPLFKTGETYPPYMAEFMITLTTVPLYVLRNKEECLAFHEFVLDHMAGKPPPVRAALLSGFHNCCKSFDLKDPEAPFKDVAYETVLEIPDLGFWTDVVNQSGNELMKTFLKKKIKNGKVIQCKYLNDLESMTTYLRVLYEHGSDYTRDKKKKNQGKRMKNKNQRAGLQQNQQAGLQQNQQAGLQQNQQAGVNQNQQAGMHQNQQAGANQNQQTGKRKKNQNQQARMHQNQQVGVHQHQQPGMQQNQQAGVNQQARMRQNQQAGMKQNQQAGVNQNQQAGVNQNQHAGERMKNQNQQGGVQQNQRAGVQQNLNQNLNVVNVLVEPQVQRLKTLDELELIGARHLGGFVLEMIYKLLKKKAMKGMMLTVWKAYKSYKISNKEP